MSLKDECKPCTTEKITKEYKELPTSLCCADDKKNIQPSKPAIKKKTIYCLRTYVRNITNQKYCLVPPRGCI